MQLTEGWIGRSSVHDGADFLGQSAVVKRRLRRRHRSRDMTDRGRCIDNNLTIVIDDNRYAAARCDNENTGDGTADFQSARLLGFAGFYGTGRFLRALSGGFGAVRVGTTHGHKHLLPENKTSLKVHK